MADPKHEAVCLFEWTLLRHICTQKVSDKPDPPFFLPV